MIRCPGCGGKNDPQAQFCDWCRLPFVTNHRRGLSARWWGIVSAAVVLLLLATVGVLLVLNASRQPNRQTAPPASAPAPPAPTQGGAPAPAPSPAPAVPASPQPAAGAPAQERPVPTLQAPATATPPPRFARVANTQGQGANLRREPSPTAPPVGLLAEGTVVRVLGPEQTAGGRVWRQIVDPRGNEGWTPADFLVDDPGPAR